MLSSAGNAFLNYVLVLPDKSFSRKPYIQRDTLAAASAIYTGAFHLDQSLKMAKQRIELHGNEDGSIPATFQIIYMASLVQFISA